MNFIQEWTPAQFKQVEKAIAKHFRSNVYQYGKPGETYRPLIVYTFGQFDAIVGLAYTSTSMCALYGVCNVDLKANDTHSFRFFAINDAGQVVAVAEDENENPLYIIL